jgi:hypothetical protein
MATAHAEAMFNIGRLTRNNCATPRLSQLWQVIWMHRIGPSLTQAEFARPL